jgi:hypothetical protein
MELEMKNHKRWNINFILKDPILRKKLMVSLIKTLQNREGIDTTTEQAEDAYDKVEREKK